MHRLPQLLVCFAVAAPVAVAADAPNAPLDNSVVAFLNKHCVSCHGADKQRAGLALHKYKDEAGLVKDRKIWENVLHMVQSGEMPPQEKPRPMTQELDGFTRSLQSLFTRIDSATRDPGHVTMRRLNRVEYANTIRDLVGVYFDATNELPQDDVGYGFDNIGDVLTISPYLMERYLTAAENVMQRAILVDLPKPSVRHLRARYLEPSTNPGNVMQFRPLYSKGKFHSAYKITLEGEYKFRVRCYGKQLGDEPVRISLDMDGIELKSFDVTATESKPATFEATVELKEGDHRGAVNFLNELTEGDKKRGLFVEYFELVGPSDTRPVSQRKLLATRPNLDKKANTRELLTAFASRAYRRPASTDEVNRLIKLVDAVEARGDKWEAGMRFAMQAVLCSPKFLFRVELDAPHPTLSPEGRGPEGRTAEPRPLDDYQLASRLSYFLWSSMPDDELFALAEKKQLQQNIDSQVRRMVQDPKSAALVENFAMQWLQLRNLKTVSPDSKIFAEWDDSLRKSMYKETELFFAAIMREDRSILDLIDADFTFVNERLARHYGIAYTSGNPFGQKKSKPGQPIRGSDFIRVNLTDGVRGGILTQASVLTITSNPTRTSPVKRGRWILEQILGTPPPPPPPNVPELAEGEQAELKGPLRQRMEQHRANPACANCHARMDPIGFAFENFNAIGKFRSKEGEFAIDASGTLPGGQSFQGPGDFKKILREKKDLFARCLAEKMLTYATGRGLEYYDKRATDGIVAALARNEYRFSTLVIEVAKSDPFRLRR